MTDTLPPCPECASTFTYQQDALLVCPECGHEWQAEDADTEAEELLVKDANGAVLADGDTVVLVKDLKIKGSSQVIKQGTKVKGIRLQEGDHNIACKIDGSGMNLKSEFVKKA